MESDSVFHNLLGCMELLPGLQACSQEDHSYVWDFQKSEYISVCLKHLVRVPEAFHKQDYDTPACLE